MATGDTQNSFDGTPTTVIQTTGTIADGVFSVAGTNATITEFDNSGTSDRWIMGKAVLYAEAFSAAPTAGTTIDLYMFEQDVDSTNDETAPSTSAQQGAKHIGSFRLFNSASAQYKVCYFSLAGVRKAKFAIKNSSGVTLNYTSGSTVKVEGFTANVAT